MTEHQASQSDTPGTSSAQQAAGGGTSRGPEFGTGGEPQVPVPPYDEYRGENTGSGAEATAKAFDASHAPARNEQRTPSADLRIARRHACEPKHLGLWSATGTTL